GRVSGVRAADEGRSSPGRRPQDPHLQEVRDGAGMSEPIPRLKTHYREKAVPRLMSKRGYVNVMSVPRLEKITVNMGVGDAIKDGRMLDAALDDLTVITGQKPVVTKARKSIAGFKLREGMAIGAKVTLRGNRMWEFLD